MPLSLNYTKFPRDVIKCVGWDKIGLMGRMGPPHGQRSLEGLDLGNRRRIPLLADAAIDEAEKLVEYLPTTPWNYGLDVSAPPDYRERAWTNDCFVAANAPCEIWVKGRRLAEWTLRDHQPAPLQESPAYSAEPLERLRFIPLGCARLRLSVLPEVSDAPSAVRWTRDRFSVPRDERAKIIEF